MSATGAIVLVGLPGSGKSTVAPMIAAQLGLDALDLDELVEQRTGSSVQDLFAQRGESGFRSEELAGLDAVLSGSPTVLATGGGVVTNPAARQLLAGSTVIWLRAGSQTIVEHLGTDATVRPLLASCRDDDELTERIESMRRERDPHYREVATAIVDVDGCSGAEVCEAVLAILESAKGSVDV